VVDPVYLGLIEVIVDHTVQFLSRREVAPEGLFDDQASPARALVKPSSAKTSNCSFKDRGRHGKIEYPVPRKLSFLFQGIDA